MNKAQLKRWLSQFPTYQGIPVYNKTDTHCARIVKGRINYYPQGEDGFKTDKGVWLLVSKRSHISLLGAKKWRLVPLDQLPSQLYDKWLKLQVLAGQSLYVKGVGVSHESYGTAWILIDGGEQ